MSWFILYQPSVMVNMKVFNRLFLDCCITLWQYPTHRVAENKSSLCYRSLAILYSMIAPIEMYD